MNKSLTNQREFLDKNFSNFFPSSANYWLYPALTYSAANNFPFQLLEIAKFFGINSNQDLLSIQDFAEGETADTLSILFDKNGSDKNHHGYAPIYARLIKELSSNKDFSILEIGIGTNDVNFISSMGAEGMPGASLRAFRDYSLNANIYGADLDNNILFSEERISTACVDQTDLNSFFSMCEQFNVHTFDLIIDDGLHSSEANLNTFIFALQALKPGGWAVIEDIPERTLAIWRCVNHLLQENRGHIIKANTAHLYLWQKPLTVIK